MVSLQHACSLGRLAQYTGAVVHQLQAFKVVRWHVNAEPLGNQPLKLTSHKKIDNEAAQRKTEESSERASGALLGGYREVQFCKFSP